MLNYIVYSSKKNSSIGDAQLKPLLEQAQEKNKALGITGILIDYDQTFLQYIEGENDSITELFSRIKSDSRHHSVELQFEGSIEKRLFPDWSMALQIVDEELFSKVDAHQSLEEGNDFIQSLEDDHTNLGLKMLRYFFDLKNNLNSRTKI
jgi:hypothetical protein